MEPHPPHMRMQVARALNPNAWSVISLPEIDPILTGFPGSAGR